MDNDILYRLTAIDPKSVDPMVLLAILEARDEIKRLREALRYEENRSNRIGTHSVGCHSWGPSHYECAMREIERLWELVKIKNDEHLLHIEGIIKQNKQELKFYSAKIEEFRKALLEIGDYAIVPAYPIADSAQHWREHTERRIKIARHALKGGK